MRAGFAREVITPPLGTQMLGYARRDRQGGCTGVHDDLYVRVLWVADAAQAALIASFDLCFLGRAEADRIKGALGRVLGLSPRQILLSTTHTHAGPSTGRCCYGEYVPADDLYLDELLAATVRATTSASRAARRVSVWAGCGRSAIPMNRRLRRPDGTISFSPNPDGTVCDLLPVVMFKDDAERPVALLNSISCHPNIAGGREISADFVGLACGLLDSHFGATCTMFLQGTGGDAKCAMSAAGGRWATNDWSLVASVAQTLMDETLTVVNGGLVRIEPRLHTALVEVAYHLQPPPTGEQLRQEASLHHEDKPALEQELRPLWARRQLDLLNRRGTLPGSAPILVQALQIGPELALMAIEGEAVAEVGLLMARQWAGGLTVPLGYANGEGLYLPVEHMLDEGGYEVESYFEFGWPAAPAEGAERIIERAVPELAELGIQ